MLPFAEQGWGSLALHGARCATAHGLQQHSRRTVSLIACATSPAPFDFTCLQEKVFLDGRVCRQCFFLAEPLHCIPELGQPAFVAVFNSVGDPRKRFSKGCYLPTAGACCAHTLDISVVPRTARPASLQTWQPLLHTNGTTQDCPFEQGVRLRPRLSSKCRRWVLHAVSASQLCFCCAVARALVTRASQFHCLPTCVS